MVRVLVGADTAATLCIPNGRDDPAQPDTDHLPMAEALNTIRKEWIFTEIAFRRMDKTHYVAVAFGLLTCVGIRIDRVVERRRRENRWCGRRPCHQRVQILPNACLPDLLGVVCLSSMDVVSHYADSRHFVAGDVFIGVGAGVLSPTNPAFPAGSIWQA